MSYDYIFIMAIILASVWLNFISSKSVVTKAVFIIAFIGMICLAGLRNDTVGRDYLVYRDYFDLSPSLFSGSFISDWRQSLPAVDLAWVVLGSTVKYLGMPFEALILLVALLSVGFSAVFYFKNSKFYTIALLLYFSHAFFYREMIQIRAGLACVMLLWSFYFFGTKRGTQGYLMFFLACITHLSAAIAIVPILGFRYEIRPSLRLVFVGLAIAIILGNVVNASFPIFSLIDRLAVYQDGEYAKSVGIITNPVTVKQIGILLGSWWLLKEYGWESFSPVFGLCLLSYFVSTLWIISFNEFEILSARGASFLSMGEPLIVAEIIALAYRRVSFKKYKRIYAIGTIVFAIMMFILNLGVKQVVDNYQTIFH